MSTDHDVLIVGGGVAGRAAGIFTARHGLDTVIVTAGSPLLRRNAHLENYPGFPAGVNSRLLLDMMLDQAQRSGCAIHDGEIVSLEEADDGFEAATAAGTTYRVDTVIAATKNATDFFPDGVDIIQRGSKNFVDTDDRGRTGIDGLYAAGRLAGEPHQTVVNAGHGAKVAVTLLEDAEEPFYHDWVAPTGYFTGRDRDVPPGCEEIDAEERRRRERESLAVMREYFADPHPDEPEQHPSVIAADDD